MATRSKSGPKQRGHNEGSVYRCASGGWAAAMTVPGNPKRKYFYGKTRAEVVERMDRARADVRSGLPLVEERQTFAQYAPTWLDAKRATVEPSTHQRLAEYVTLHLLPDIGRLRLTDITPQRVQALYAKKLAQELSPTTVNHLHGALHQALQDALRLGLVARNVCDLVKAPRTARHEMHVLSPEQARALLEAAREDAHGALYTLALTTGMRQGELLALKWADTRLDDGTLVIQASLRMTRGGGYRISEPKTRASRRRIRLSPIAVEALRMHRTRQKALRVKLGPLWQDLGLVFPNTLGRPQDARGLSRYHFYPFLERHALPRIRFHDLRHTAATLLLGQRVNPKIVSEMLGHASIAITLDIYSHVLPEMQEDAVDAMERVLGRVNVVS